MPHAQRLCIQHCETSAVQDYKRFGGGVGLGHIVRSAESNISFNTCIGARCKPKPLLLRSRGGAIREGIQHCLQHMEPRGGVVLWQEPEKVDLVRWYRTIARPLWHSEAHIVVPVRQAKAFQV